MTQVIVSACLAGICCRYHGGHSRDERIATLAAGKAVPVCPEELGGLTTPRPAAEVVGGDGADVLEGSSRVTDARGMDVTQHFIAGAQKSLETARAVGARVAVLKDGSPSCGSSYIMRGGEQLPGRGVAAALLTRSGIEVISNESPGLNEFLSTL